jgi:hypothetical protein
MLLNPRLKWEENHINIGWGSGGTCMKLFDCIFLKCRSILLTLLSMIVGIYRKPVIGETYSDTMKCTTIWQFPLITGHCHSISNTCNDGTYMLIILEAQVEMIFVAMTSYAWAF